jgi:Protein of unknown function (DUF2968)
LRLALRVSIHAAAGSRNPAINQRFDFHLTNTVFGCGQLISGHSICHNPVGFALFKELGNSMKYKNKWWRGGVLWAGTVVCTAVFTGTTALAVTPAGQDSLPAPGNALGDASARRGLLSNGAADEPQTPGTGNNGANGSITELQQMIRDGKVMEMRTTYNGSYGASMLFYPDQMTYYVALFQQKKFWRVIKTQTDTRAEAVYADLAKSTSQLAASEISREKLQAENAYADRLIALQQNRANRLQADVDVARAQQTQVVDRQAQQQAAIVTLRAQQDAAQAELRALQAKVQDLQRQTDGDLMPMAK